MVERDGPRRTLASMGPLGLGQCSCERGHPAAMKASCHVVLHSTTKHFVLEALRRGSLPQLQNAASKNKRAPPLPGVSSTAQQGLAKTVGIRMGVARHRPSLRQNPCVENLLEPLAPLQRAVAEANEPHAKEELITKTVVPIECSILEMKLCSRLGHRK